jgi:hypothetical protein
MFVGSLVCFVLAVSISWSPGMTGEHKGDEAVRDVLVTLAVLAWGLALAVMFVGVFLLDIAIRLRKLESQGRPAPDDSKRSS